VDPTTLPTLLGLAPDALALDDLTRARTWRELDDRVARWRGLFASFGVAPGDHVAMVMGNRVEFVELVLAALTAGVWMTPVNWHATRDEIAYVLDDADASLVLAAPQFADVTRAASRTTPVIVVGAELDERLSRTPAVPLDPAGVPGANMIYTSGTTGRPKGVRRGRQADIVQQLTALRRAGDGLGLDGFGPHLVTGPLYHAAPLGFAVMDLLNGGPLVVMPTFDAEHMLALVTERNVRTTHLVPTMFVRLLRLPEASRARFDPIALRTVLHGAAPIAPAIKRRMIDWWGPVLVEYWGASEGGVVTLVGSEDWLAHPGTVGRAIVNHEVFAADPDGTVLEPGQTGVLWCRNTAVEDVFSYHNDAAKTAGAFREPGVYTIGDIGRVDDEGYVYLADRVSHMIISGGVNIYPAEIEAVLIEHPTVVDVAVFGVPDDEWGESVRAAVQLAPGRDPSPDIAAELIAFARERLSAYKAPRAVEFHDELPRAPTGKIATRVLKDPHWRDR
jgi:long-chain acyl-CoA synthetase